jgi:hypothetical protein
MTCRCDVVNQNGKHRVICCLLLLVGMEQVLNQFFWYEMSWGALTIMTVLSMLVWLLASLLCFYAIGFTTIRVALFATAVFAVMLSCVVTDFPLKLRFAMAEEKLEELAGVVQAGGEIDSPLWAEPLHIKKVAVRSGGAHFWTDLHRSGGTRVVYLPDGKAQLLGRIWEKRKLSDHWFYVCYE